MDVYNGKHFPSIQFIIRTFEKVCLVYLLAKTIFRKSNFKFLKISTMPYFLEKCLIAKAFSDAPLSIKFVKLLG